jgi:hypothetical protein
MQPGHLDQFLCTTTAYPHRPGSHRIPAILRADRISASYGIKLAIREPFSASHYDENEEPQDNASQIPGYWRCA